MNPSLLLTLAEAVATLAGVLSVYFLTIGQGRGWSLGIVWIVLTGFVFWSKELWGSFGLQFFFLITQCWAWWRWFKNPETDLRTQCLSLSGRWRAALTGLLLLVWFVVYWALNRSDGALTLADSFVTTASVLAQSLLVLGYWECWPLWLGINLIYVGMSFHQHLWGFVALYGLFCGLSVKGWREWTRDRE